VTTEPPTSPAVLTADEHAYITAAAHAAAITALTRIWEHRAQRHHAAYAGQAAAIPVSPDPETRGGWLHALAFASVLVAAVVAYVVALRVWS
jgi:ferric-dicitrate binding protein FerR (iron transport regulator)